MVSIKKINKYSSHFDEKSLFKKISLFAEFAGTNLVFYALILFFLIKDRQIPIRIRIIFVAALGYFILPTDLISDIVPGLGFTDDLTFITYAISQGTNYITTEIKLKAKSKLSNLLGYKVLSFD